MMSGEMPAEIHAHLSGEASLPESGYRETGAWDACAVSDFVYLSLVLIRGLDSSAAIKQSHLAAPFTDKDKVAGSAFAPMGLTETEPE
jgi:hypothetical protein